MVESVWGFFFKKHNLVFALAALLTVDSLYAIEVPEQTETRYIDEVDAYERMMKQHGLYEEVKTFQRTPPFTTTKNSMLIDMNNEIYESSNFEHPCPTRISEKPPQITLLAESHYCPNCNIDFVKTIIESRRGKSVLAMEGIPFGFGEDKKLEDAERGYLPTILDGLPKSGLRVWGIDSSSEGFIADLISALQLLNTTGETLNKKERGEPLDFDPSALEKGANDPEAYATNLLFLVISKTLTNAENSSALAEFYDSFPEMKAPLNRIELALKKIQSKRSTTDEVIKQSMDVMNRELTFNFLQKFVATFLKIKLKTYAKTETKLSRSFSQLLIDDKLNVMDASTLEVIDGVMTVTLRNVAFAQNIAKLYCENALNSGRELVVSLGAEHAEAQRYLLEKIFKSGKVSPVIKFKPLATDYMAMTPEQRKSKLKKDFGEIRLVK